MINFKKKQINQRDTMCRNDYLFHDSNKSLSDNSLLLHAKSYYMHHFRASKIHFNETSTHVEVGTCP